MHALIDSWNMDRVLKLLAKHPRYAELKPKLIEILEGQIKKRQGEEYSEFKYSYQPSHDSSPFFDYEGAEHDEADIVSGNEFDGDAWDNLLCSIYENPPADIEAATPESRAFTRFLKEEFGFDLDHQGIALSRNDRMYKAGLRFIPDIFKRALDIVEPAPKSAKSAQPLWPPAPKLDAGLVLEANCASCHRKGNSVAAKYIPFHPLNRFKKVLNEKLAAQIEERLSTKNEDRRMPKYHPPLSEEEKAILLRYLRENVSKEKSGGRRIRTRMGYRSNL